MGIWVRSQDKRRLINANNLSVRHMSIYTYDIIGKEIYLGSYKTEERAIEILNDIQNILMNINPSAMGKSIVVYEMPQE